MSDNVKPVKGVGFTQKERVLCIKALMTYREIDMTLYLASRQLPTLPPSDYDKKVIDLLIDDFKGPSWDGERFVEGLDRQSPRET